MVINENAIRVLTALYGAALKWDRIARRLDVDRASRNCPLCQVFGHACRLCPIKKDTGISACERTPYIHWLRSSTSVDGEYYLRRNDNPKSQEEAERMRDYIISLFPRIEDMEEWAEAYNTFHDKWCSPSI